MDFQSGMVALAPESGGGFKIVRKAEWGESGERGEILKSCAKLNGESLGWIFNVGTGGDFKIVHKLNGGSLGGWYSLLPATNFCSEWSVDRDQTTGGGALVVLVGDDSW